jgi:hypothetical protein
LVERFTSQPAAAPRREEVVAETIGPGSVQVGQWTAVDDLLQLSHIGDVETRSSRGDSDGPAELLGCRGHTRRLALGGVGHIAQTDLVVHPQHDRKPAPGNRSSEIRRL